MVYYVKRIHSQFKKFERGEGGRLMYTSGTGLGLYVAKLMAEAHHSSISGDGSMHSP